MASPRYHLEYLDGRRLGADGALLRVRTGDGYRRLEAVIQLSEDRETDDDALCARLVEVMAETA